MLTRHRRGITLLDMAVYIALTAIVAAIGLPRYATAVQNFRAAQAANRIAADLALAQWTAKSTSTSAGTAVTFDVTNNAYTVAGASAVSLSDAPYYATLVSASFGTGTSATFDRYGQPSAGGTVVIVVGLMQKTITLDANSGKATIQ